MGIRDLVPTFGKKGMTEHEEDSPFYKLQKEMNRLFDDFFEDFQLTSFEEKMATPFNPRVNVRETEKSVEISAELPGIEEKEIDISVSNDSVTIKGEKKEEKEEKGECFHRVERSYGSFQRQIPLPCEIEMEKAEAAFKDGVLNITLPKSPEAQKNVRKIQIKSS